jgi:hypothetical protein
LPHFSKLIKETYMDNKSDIPVHIDLKVIQQTIRSAINEAGIYAGFTYNVRNDETFINYALVEDSNIQFVPITQDPLVIKDYKEYFYDWVIKNSFKYVVDRFSIFLDQIYYVCLLYGCHKKKYTQDLIDSLEKQKSIFHKINFVEKLKELKIKFEVAPLKNDFILSIQSTRNCLTHRDGTLGSVDLKSNSEFIVMWTGFHIYGKNDSGDEIDLNTIPPDGIVLPGDMNILLRQNADKQKIFKLGEKIRFSSKEFAEILLYLRNETDYMLNCALKYSDEIGVPKVK